MKKILIVVLTIILITLTSTLAFYRWSSNKNIDVAMNLSGLDAFIHYNKGTDVLTGTLFPSTDYTGGISTEIELWKDPSAETRNIYGHIYMDITTIGTNLANEPALKWAIVSEDELLNFGDFEGQKTGDTINLKINIPLSIEKKLFKIYIWLDESMDINYDIEGETLSTKIKAEATEIETIYSDYCKYNNITNFRECLIRSDSYTDYDTALINIDNKTSKLDLTNLNTIEPSNYYEPLITEYNYDINSNSNMATTTNTSFTYVEESSLVYNGENTPDNITFNNETYKYTYINSKTGGIEDIITTEEDIQNGKYKYTCLNTTANGNCDDLYIIYSYRYANDRYEFKSGYKYSNKNIGGTSVRTGLFKTIDDYSKDLNNDGEIDSNFTYFYRGDVQNNWVEYAGSLWRIIRINGNGSIRIIYSGSAAEGASHTGQYATIKNSKGSYYSTYSAASPKTNIPYNFSSTHVGYMYNSEMNLVTTPSVNLDSVNDLSKFQYVSYTNPSTKYYFFNSLNLNNNCSLEDETCTMICTDYDSTTGKGDNCIYSTWSSLATNTNNYDINGVGSTSTSYRYTGDYRYVCMNNVTITTEGYNLIVKCPIVTEMLGVLKSGSSTSSTASIRREHGLFSTSYEISTSNVLDSNAKYEVDNWYEKNILNKKDSQGNLLSNYLSDEIFCNDRTLTSGNGYNFDLGSNIYGSYYRNDSNKNPSLICQSENDRFTVNNNLGNGDLDYPIALITLDEVTLAGGKIRTNNYRYYLNIDFSFWTMSPFNFENGTPRVMLAGVSPNGLYLTLRFGLRPVINLSSEVLYFSGSGTETDPYKIKLN